VKPSAWTLIISSWSALARYEPQDRTALRGSFGYTPDKDLVRSPMKLDLLPFSIDQLTWMFLDMTDQGGRLARSRYFFNSL